VLRVGSDDNIKVLVEFIDHETEVFLALLDTVTLLEREETMIWVSGVLGILLEFLALVVPELDLVAQVIDVEEHLLQDTIHFFQFAIDGSAVRLLLTEPLIASVYREQAFGDYLRVDHLSVEVVGLLQFDRLSGI
jgi:hypothetical protein